MGFLHKLWDETLAGPTPENGLGKLRKHISGRENVTKNGDMKLMVDISRVPDSPTGTSESGSPLAPRTPSETHATKLNACDWIVLNALDR
ncbi:unnamed protein product [Cochlearia groenlandica]